MLQYGAGGTILVPHSPTYPKSGLSGSFGRFLNECVGESVENNVRRTSGGDMLGELTRFALITVDRHSCVSIAIGPD